MATGTILIKNPNGKSGTFRVVSVDSTIDECGELCNGRDLTFVDPGGNSGVIEGGQAIGKIVEAGSSGVYVIIDLHPQS